SIMKKNLVSTGIVRFKKPDLFYMELKPPHASKMVLRDASVEVFIPQDNSRQQITLPGDGGLKHWLGLLDQPIRSVPENMSITAQNSGDIQTVTISPQKKGQIKAITITSGRDGKPKRLQISERNGNYTSITFKNLRANIGLTEKDFKI
ncbi:MAG: outer membrane lipoprotein carrier protein LolA, partial [Desulfuromonadales bacterium]|nr:outer membrane lipoprotein carrier protein LolA [Desulfuromonadales bacterium]